MKKYSRIKWNTKTKYKLWTFQSTASIDELKNKGRLEASWDRYAETDVWLGAYQWMVNQITARKILLDNKAPIWAWHSCGKYKSPPTLLDARCLLSDAELQRGIQMIEFECPSRLVALSSYGAWNALLHNFFYTNDQAKIDNKTINKLFKANRKKFRKYDSIQATLPYLKLAWVKDIRQVNLKPNDFDYDPKEKV